ncbi:MAG: RNA repair transcriptional activator RtcR family protein [Bacillota bacterium]|nr:RNA repair transcriptional activator RtcR family protein [Bacillota bacterium]
MKHYYFYKLLTFCLINSEVFFLKDWDDEIIMFKVLISSVGNNDPQGRNQSDGPVLTAVKELNPNVIYLFPTRKQVDPTYTWTEDNSEALIRQLQENYPELMICKRPLNLPDPTDYRSIIQQLTDEIDEIKNQYSKSETEYYISVSSGTPQIQAAFLVLVSSNRIKAKTYQVINPQFIKNEQSRLREVDTHFLEESNQIRRAKEYFSCINFDASANEMCGLACYTIYPKREKIAETFLDLIKGYFHWDLYQHWEAKDCLEKSYEHIQRYGFVDLSNKLESQLKILDQIIKIGEVEDYINLADLYHNAHRRYLCKQYIDCLSRFKRIYEGVFYYIAHHELGINAKSNIEYQPEEVKKEIKKKRGFLNTYDISKLYEGRKNQKIIPETLENKLNEFSKQRNNTINNHGMNSVEAEQAKKALDLAAELLRIVFPDNDLSGYPFSKEALTELENLIFSNL